jgi:peptidyl-prolyl cis-trans isomerase SurA
MKKAFLITGLACIGSLGLVQAQNHKVVADQIVGIVGDKIVLQSDVTNSILDAKRRGQQLPENAECILMQQILAQKAMVLQAEKDSIVVSDEDIDAKLENQIREFIAQYGSKEALEQIAGRTVYQIKDDFRQSFKEKELARKMRDKIVESIKITPVEVKAFYDKIPKDQLPFYETEVEVGEILIYPKANRDLEKYAMEELNDYKKQVESGQKKFETLASLYTDDPGSKDKGGMYNINRNEKQWDPAFLNAAFRLKDGQISPVFKSKFGYHIIQMVSRNGDDAIVRHILKIPQITDDELNDAVKVLDSVRTQLVAGKIGFGEAVSRYTDDENAKFTAGMHLGQDNSTFLTIDQLDKDIVKQLDNLKAGDYSKPLVSTDPTGKKMVRIIYLKTRTEPHRANLKDDYNKMADKAIEEKKDEAMEKWFNSKLPTFYIMLDDEFKNCPELAPWYKNATADK